MSEVTTRQNLQVKDACGLNLESQPNAQYIHGNNVETNISWFTFALVYM
jgi:hypothetical protein